MDRAVIRIIRVTEELLFGPARASESGAVAKEALLLHRPAGTSAVDFRADVERLCAALLAPRSTGFLRLQLELPVAPDEGPLAFDAVVTAWPQARDDPPSPYPNKHAMAGITHLRL